MNRVWIAIASAALLEGAHLPGSLAEAQDSTWLQEGCTESGYVWDSNAQQCVCPAGLSVVEGACVRQSMQATQMSDTPLGWFYSAYSPSIMNSRIWYGGWDTQQDQCPPGTEGTCDSSVPGFGEDKIYFSDLIQGDMSQGTWSEPTLSLYSPGNHVNDPSVVAPPNEPTWLFMYYTILNDQDATADSMTTSNHCGLASSIDGGTTWTERGIVIDDCWSPSALVVGDEIWLYYHTGSQDWREMRTRFQLDGWSVIDTTELSFHTTQGPVYISNLDVHANMGNKAYLMLANDGSLTQILQFVSADGLTWVQDPVAPLIDGGPNAVLTPTAVPVDGSSYAVYFGYATPAGTNSTSIQAWTFPNAPSAPPVPQSTVSSTVSGAGAPLTSTSQSTNVSISASQTDSSQASTAGSGTSGTQPSSTPPSTNISASTSQTDSSSIGQNPISYSSSSPSVNVQSAADSGKASTSPAPGNLLRKTTTSYSTYAPDCAKLGDACGLDIPCCDGLSCPMSSDGDSFCAQLQSP